MVTTGLNPNSARTFLRKRKTMASQALRMKKGAYKKTAKKSASKKVVKKVAKKGAKASGKMTMKKGKSCK